jgi:hypothetical protein
MVELEDYYKFCWKAVNGVYESSLKMWGEPIDFNFYNNSVLFTFEEIKNCFEEWNINEDLFNFCLNNNLLPELYIEDNERGYPNYLFQRVNFINELMQNWKYDVNKLKIIIEYEDALIEAYNSDAFEYYPDSIFDPNDIFLNWAMKKFARYAHDVLKKSDSGKKVLSNYDILAFVLKYFAKYDDNRSEKNKFNLKKIFYYTERQKESIRIKVLSEFNARLLTGFSPNIYFESDNIRVYYNENLMNQDTINQALAKGEFKYTNDYGIETYCYPDWSLPKTANDDNFDFFATPEFLIYIDKSKKIQIEVRNPDKVDSHYMRKIGKVYSIFRSSFNPKKRKWGEKTGRKRIINERNKALKSIYGEMRIENPTASAERQLEKALEGIKNEYGELSIDTAKRIIYKKQ